VIQPRRSVAIGIGNESRRNVASLTATEIVRELRRGNLTAESHIRACLERVEAREEEVGAWAYLDPDRALADARKRDRERRAGKRMGALHGVAIGIKDIIDTSDMPTALGSSIYARRRPARDAHAVTLLRNAGAVILGKTVTTEFAGYTPGKTRNPLDPRRTPGGSSSGSAAAVADHMVPLAIGTQTAGSVIRPASFCGVYGYKPSFGAVSRSGMRLISRYADHVGMFARSLEDLALISDVIMQPDPADRDTRGVPRPLFRKPPASRAGKPPRLAFVRSPAWPQASQDVRSIFENYCRRLGKIVFTRKLPEMFRDAPDIFNRIVDASWAESLATEYAAQPAELGPVLKEHIAAGQTISATSYLKAVAAADRLAQLLDGFLQEFDAIVTPATPGEAPLGLASTGNAAFNLSWTLCGVPAMTLPLLKGPDNMPMGVQLVARRGDDPALFRVAHWLAKTAAGE
jgi:Asp-tRNA(Asn)/Glu-tRNA(Gln) amidotransferase A subunit family amidase